MNTKPIMTTGSMNEISPSHTNMKLPGVQNPIFEDAKFEDTKDPRR